MVQVFDFLLFTFDFYLVLQNIPHKIMILRKGRQVIMSATGNADECYLSWIKRLQFFTVTYRQQPIPGAMQDISMAIYFGYPFIGTHVIP